MDTRIWRSVDGHLFRSVPAASLPEKWRRTADGLVSGDYVIVRGGTGPRAFTYDLFRLWVRIGFTMSTLRAAKSHAILNARGEDRVNVA